MLLGIPQIVVEPTSIWRGPAWNPQCGVENHGCIALRGTEGQEMDLAQQTYREGKLYHGIPIKVFTVKNAHSHISHRSVIYGMTPITWSVKFS